MGDILCRIVKFAQSFSMMSLTNIVVAMAIDRCVAILKPLNAREIRVMYLCSAAWFTAFLLSLPNSVIFSVRMEQGHPKCMALFQFENNLLARRIYLTFISIVVYFLPSLTILLCYGLIFLKLWQQERRSTIKIYGVVKQPDGSVNSDSNTCGHIESYDSHKKNKTLIKKRISFPAHSTIYGRAKSKTFWMIIILVSCMILFGLPYYCLELVISYRGFVPNEIVYAIAGTMAVAPSSVDPWIFLLFWVKRNSSSIREKRQHPTNENGKCKTLMNSNSKQKQFRNTL
ncbi:unnamed protein product [Didymodactylos carnosus]|uniref:G-protein coupled receptors family 1 profile domain-containing protein n=1 Tax=Didymodactylos carnosus TaxID=1234261 RepID=A0A814A6F1_9BILA|nr:unnamed protein product [Didymodactylos carnosus]CAF1353614.1 unnamed protein product [Didymodactylos carnosus]CAF3691468.1 unnamed protein product [Didymodactylos carnosus]CAF4164049.1 unnamed protein product [Didymodactylos carnosus]